MLPRRFALVMAGLGLLSVVTLLPSQQGGPDTDSGIFDQAKVEFTSLKTQDGVEQQAQGPVHEAFANPSTASAPLAQPVVVKAPPPPVEEMPPDQKPEGDNVQWLSGYWAYDPDTKDFLWVSGLWRQIPPGMDWVPGAWSAVAGGYQWSSGFWRSALQTSLSVVPPPPEPLNAADAPAPAADSTYVPGCWVYRETRYVWRPSYWMPCRPGWVWVPARYVWSPCGYYFVDGYWDYTLRNRGLLFCPVIIQRAYLRPGFIYRPYYVVHDQCLLSCLFVNTTFGCYYFGDYYDVAYSRRGYIAWSSYRVRGRYHDCLYDHYRFLHRGNPAWERDLVNLTALRVRNEAPRPPITLSMQNKMLSNAKFKVNQTKNVVLLAPLAKVNPKVVTLVKLDAVKLQEQQKFAKKLHEASVNRAALEGNLIRTKTMPKVGDPVRTLAVTVPRNHALPTASTLKTLPPPPTGGTVQVDPKVISGLGKFDHPKDKAVTKDKVVITPGKDKAIVPPPKDKVIVPPSKDKVIVPPAKDKVIVPPSKDKVIIPPPKDRVIVPPSKDKGALPEKDKAAPPEKDKKKVAVPTDATPAERLVEFRVWRSQLEIPANRDEAVVAIKKG